MLTYYSDGTLFGTMLLGLGLIAYVGLALQPLLGIMVNALVSTLPPFLLGIALRALLYPNQLLVIPPVPFFVALIIQILLALVIFIQLKRYHDKSSLGWRIWFVGGGVLLYFIVPPTVLQILNY